MTSRWCWVISPLVESSTRACLPRSRRYGGSASVDKAWSRGYAVGELASDDVRWWCMDGVNELAVRINVGAQVLYDTAVSGFDVSASTGLSLEKVTGRSWRSASHQLVLL